MKSSNYVLPCKELAPRLRCPTRRRVPHRSIAAWSIQQFNQTAAMLALPCRQLLLSLSLDDQAMPHQVGLSCEPE